MTEQNGGRFTRGGGGDHQWRERGDRSWRGERRAGGQGRRDDGGARRSGGARRFGGERRDDHFGHDSGYRRAGGDREDDRDRRRGGSGRDSGYRDSASRGYRTARGDRGAHRDDRFGHDSDRRREDSDSGRGARGYDRGRARFERAESGDRRGARGYDRGRARFERAESGDRRGARSREYHEHRGYGSARQDRGERRGYGGERHERRFADRSGAERPRENRREARPEEPAIPAGVNTEELDPQARRELRALPEPLRDVVAGHLAAAGELIDLDPQEAYRHAQAAVRRASRLDVVREAAALTAYASGRYDEALREVRAVRRMRGDDSLRAVEADCERGLGHPEKAVEIVEATDTSSMGLADQVELVLVASGARADLGQSDVGLVLVQDALAALPADAEPELRRRLMSVQVDRLRELGRDEDADAAQAGMPPEEDEAEIVDVGSFMDADVDDRPSDLKGADQPLQAAYDAALLDLDGVCYRGAAPVEHAAEAANAAQNAGMKVAYLTNNASRTPEEIAQQLRSLGFSLEPSQVTTSAIDAARLLRETLPADATVLPIGGPGLMQAVAAQELATVETADAHPAAVVLGWDPAIGWKELSEVAYAVQGGAQFYVTNMDTTLPTERGFAVGNGSLARAVQTATGVAPVAAGKPGAGIYRRVVAALGVHKPLGVGDRLNTDVAGARAAGFDSLHVLTGVDSARAIVVAEPDERPTYVGLDLRALGQPQPEPKHHADGTWTCGLSQVARIDEDGRPELDGTPLVDPTTVTVDSYRAIVAAAWDFARSGERVRCPELTVVDNHDPAGIVPAPAPAAQDKPEREEQDKPERGEGE